MKVFTKIVNETADSFSDKLFSFRTGVKIRDSSFKLLLGLLLCLLSFGLYSVDTNAEFFRLNEDTLRESSVVRRTVIALYGSFNFVEFVFFILD